jgi:hypothetical protein
MAGYAREHPGWTAVYVEFWTHASRRPELRRRVAEQHERLLDAVGGPVEEWTARWAVEFTLPAREVVRGIYARDRWSRDRLLAFQGERLRALIAHAVAASPYYRDLLGPDAASGDMPLAELPTLPKATLMESFDQIVTDPRLRRAELEAHLAGPDAGRPFLGRYRVFTTAGTTGVRGLFVEDVDEFAEWIGTACAAWPAGGWGRRRGWPGSAPPARCTSPTRCTPCRRPGSPAPPHGWPSPPRRPRWSRPSMPSSRGPDRLPERGRGPWPRSSSRAACGSRRRWSPPPRRCRRPTCAGA